jgi:Helix-loop-helix DNA-binding domain
MNPTNPYNLPLPSVTSASPRLATSRAPDTVASAQGVASGTRTKRQKSSSTPPSAGVSDGGEMNPTFISPSMESMPPPSVTQRQKRPSQGDSSPSVGIEPVTPSIIMGLDMKNTSRQTRSSNGTPARSNAQNQSKAPTSVTESKSNISSKVNSTAQSIPSTSTSTRATQRKQTNNTTTQPPKKHTHKDAEQKRRDSLKTSFDELRDLLPPIPLALEDPRFSENPPLPGSLPPRGPPKGDAGPNRHVSKLHLLRCGNDYIRQLNGRIERRDREIEKLRSEILRLRNYLAGDRILMECGEEIDLEEDLDAEEDNRLGIGGGCGEQMSTVVEEGEDGNES